MEKIAIITGSARGIGREIVKQLFHRGSNVIFTYKHSAKAAEMLYNELSAISHKDTLIKYFQCDLADMESVRKIVHENKDDFSKIDVIINNAGIISNEPQFLITADMDIWWKVLRNNIACVINPIRAIAPFMIRRKSGTIINVSSISGQWGDSGQSAYAASKAAIANLTKTINKELSSFGIIANCVSPGLIDTMMTKGITEKFKKITVSETQLKRSGKPSEVASLITYLALDAPSYLIDQNITISGGL